MSFNYAMVTFLNTPHENDSENRERETTNT